jgi:hypothetical protein
MTVAFDCTTIDGHPITIETPTQDAAAAALKDQSAPADKRALAQQVLRWYAQRLDENVDRSELGKAAWLALTDYWASDLWAGKKKLTVETIRGTERLVIVEDVPVTLEKPPQPAEQVEVEPGDSNDEPLTAEEKLEAARDFARSLRQYTPFGVE